MGGEKGKADEGKKRDPELFDSFFHLPFPFRFPPLSDGLGSIKIVDIILFHSPVTSSVISQLLVN